MVNLNKVGDASHLHRIDKKNRQREVKKREVKNDRIEISAEGKTLLKIQRAKARLKEVPDVREERILQVNRRIRDGYYQREDVQKATVDRFLAAIGLR